MRKIPARTYQTVEQIDQRAAALEAQASLLQNGAEKSAILFTAHQLRTYADMKRLLTKSA
jgi:hypothetical protein